MYRDCARCTDVKKSSDWSPDVIVRRREHPATILQAPLYEDDELARCRYATQLKSWYDEQYNDWAKRYLRERLYNPDGVDRAAVYVFTKLVPPSTTTRKSIAPTKPADDRQYMTTCKRFVLRFCTIWLFRTFADAIKNVETFTKR